ncbi:MAG TPA: DinB family protein [Thermoanaerobaculia bacterium]|jgi:uncharacterized damage-inducible protein DinB
MKRTLAAVLLLGGNVGLAAAPPPAAAPPLKALLLEQLKMTHDVQDWFVPAKQAVAGLTAEQAFWKPGNADHSAAELVSHLLFWDKQQLATFKGEKPPAYSGKNDDTFQMVTKANWDASVRELDAVMTEWEKAVEAADDAKLQKNASTIAHIAAHNAYHTGQILYVRKQQGSWDAAKGVH